jgi:hypothetical protein
LIRSEDFGDYHSMDPANDNYPAEVDRSRAGDLLITGMVFLASGLLWSVYGLWIWRMFRGLFQ